MEVSPTGPANEVIEHQNDLYFVFFIWLIKELANEKEGEFGLNDLIILYFSKLFLVRINFFS